MKELSVILACTVKFAMTFPYAIYVINLSFWETIIFCNVGGLIGLLASAYLSKIILWLWQRYIAPLLPQRKKEKKIFTSRNRNLVMIKSRYGLPGIVILSPVLLSIPIGSFLLTKYYGIRFKTICLMASGQIAWSFIYTVFFVYIRDLLC